MYAIVDIAGQQYKVEKDQKIFVHRLEGKEGSKVDFDKILLIDNDGKITVGDPLIKNMVVTASILSHLKGDKVKVFKKKRRKGYKVLNGHRQYLTEIHIDGIGEGKVKAEPKKESVKEVAEKKESKKDPASATKKDTKAPSVKATATKTKAGSAAAEKKSESVTTKKTTASKSTSSPAAETKPKTKKAPAKKPAAKAASKTKKAGEKKSDK